MVDSHSHSLLSHDGKASIEAIRDKAIQLGAEYLAITEHLDRDYLYCGLGKERFIRQLNLAKYQREFARVKAQTQGIYLAYGIEASYMLQAEKRYLKELNKYPFDVIINSVHSIYKGDMYLGKAFRHSRGEVYNAYLDAVLDSVNAPYDYDIVGHIGYVARYAPYDQKSICTPELMPKIDEILHRIIQRDKTIECNTNIKLADYLFLPEIPLLQRYKELGGKRITFSSDAHTPDRVCDKYKETCKAVKALGFTHWTIYKQRQPVDVPIDDV